MYIFAATPADRISFQKPSIVMYCQHELVYVLSVIGNYYNILKRLPYYWRVQKGAGKAYAPSFGSHFLHFHIHLENLGSATACYVHLRKSGNLSKVLSLRWLLSRVILSQISISFLFL